MRYLFGFKQFQVLSMFIVGLTYFPDRVVPENKIDLSIEEINSPAYDGGDFSIDFATAAHVVTIMPQEGGAFNDGTTNVDNVESLESGDIACGDLTWWCIQFLQETN